MSDKAKQLYDFSQREFLNKTEGMAAVNSYVKVSRHGNYINFDTELNISDCSRVVTLEFDPEYHGGTVAMRDKVKRFRRLLNEHLDALVEAYDVYDRAQKAVNKEKKENPS